MYRVLIYSGDQDWRHCLQKVLDTFSQILRFLWILRICGRVGWFYKLFLFTIDVSNRIQSRKSKVRRNEVDFHDENLWNSHSNSGLKTDKYQDDRQNAARWGGKTQNYQNLYWGSIFYPMEIPHTKYYGRGSLGYWDTHWIRPSVKSGSVPVLI